MAEAGADDPDDEKVADEDDDSLNEIDVPKIGKLWRAAASLTAAAELTFGTLAVFKTNVEAGPVALLVVGLIFATTAASGHVPWRIKIGDNEIELQRARREVTKARRAKNTAEEAAVAVAAAAPTSVSVREVVDRTEAVSPVLGAALANSVGFEAKVSEMLRHIVEGVPDASFTSTEQIAEWGQGSHTQIDGLLERGENSPIAVEIRASAKPLGPTLVRGIYERQMQAARKLHAEKLLLITQQSLTQSAVRELENLPLLYWIRIRDESDRPYLEKMIKALVEAT